MNVKVLVTTLISCLVIFQATILSVEACSFLLKGEQQCTHWSYQKAAIWQQECPFSSCGGRSQSPISISLYQTTLYETYFMNAKAQSLIMYDFSTDDKRLIVFRGIDNFFQQFSFSVINNNHTIVMESVNEESISIERSFWIRNNTWQTFNSITVPYYLKQFHLHSPSEHLVNSESFDLELHLVFQRNDLPSNTSEALVPKLAVVGILYKVLLGAIDNPLVDIVIQNVLQKPRVIGKPIPTTVTGLLLFDLVTARQQFDPLYSYFVYNGSLTTPNCNENVMWNLINPNIMSGGYHYISSRQLTTLQQLMNQNKPHIAEGANFGKVQINTGSAYIGNNRPLQPLNGRTIINIVKKLL